MLNRKICIGIRAKIVFIGALTFIWGVLIFNKLVQTQIINNEGYVQQAKKQQHSQGKIAAPRGTIYDSRMEILAANTTLRTVVAVPNLIEDIPEAAKKLASVLGIDRGTLQSRMETPERKYYLRVERRIDENMEKVVADLDIKGVYFEDESVRSYPNSTLACHVLGFVNMNDAGGTGIEEQYDSILKGTTGSFTFARDGRRTPRAYETQLDTAPVQGHSLVLSIDKKIQFIADSELAVGVKKTGARAGTAIVMESDTGRILAMSNYPRFDGNKFREYPSESRYNRALTDVFEPGSTFKVAVAASALKEGLTRPDEMIDCQNGAITIGGHVFRDHNKHGILSFNKMLAVSSNVGAAKLGLRLGRERLYESVRMFGFGSPTGIDLPLEESGILRHPDKWSNLSIGAISFGYEVGVTSIQILTAVNTIANGGFRVKPYVVDRIIDSNGNLVDITSPERVRIIEEKTAREVAAALKEAVLPGGTATRAALEGYVAAGKTGTAQKLVEDPASKSWRYSNSRHAASFVGFAPLPNPKITIIVQLDEPRNGHYGGEVSAPIFQIIAQKTLGHLKVPSDPTLSSPQPKSKQSKQMVATNTMAEFLSDAAHFESVMYLAKNRPDAEDLPGVFTVPVAEKNVVTPDFSGLSKRTVLDICIDLDVRLKSAGSGIAVSQNPPPGTHATTGDVFTVVFAKPDDAVKKEPVATGQRVTSAAGRI